MKRVEVKLSLPVVAPLLDVVKDLASSLQQTLAAKPELPDTDLVFRDVWSQELLATQTEDVTALLALFNDDFFTEGIVAFDQSNAESIARACSAIRLCLREHPLRNLGDEALEMSEVDLTRLDEPTRKAFMCYLFLATIQELIIQHLDESIMGS